MATSQQSLESIKKNISVEFRLKSDKRDSVISNNVRSACSTPKCRSRCEGEGTSFLLLSEGLHEFLQYRQGLDGWSSVYFTSTEGNAFSQKEMLKDELAWGLVCAPQRFPSMGGHPAVTGQPGLELLSGTSEL